MRVSPVLKTLSPVLKTRSMSISVRGVDGNGHRVGLEVTWSS
jgi:hypothetical protein